MIIKTEKLNFKNHEVNLLVRPGTQDLFMAKDEVFSGYYFRYGGLTIKPGDTVIDLGANVGSFCILAGIEGAEKIIAVEAFPETIGILEENLKGNAQYFKNPVTVFRGACMATANDSFPMYINNDPAGSGSHTLNLGPNDKPENHKSIEVKTFTLDQIIEQAGLDHVDFLKVDIEGAEYEVIDFCSKLNLVRQISFEWHYGVKNFCHLVTKLIDSGYRIAWFEGDNERGKLQVTRG